jgi:hypothetical protein
VFKETYIKEEIKNPPKNHRINSFRSNHKNVEVDIIVTLCFSLQISLALSLLKASPKVIKMTGPIRNKGSKFKSITNKEDHILLNFRTMASPIRMRSTI